MKKQQRFFALTQSLKHPYITYRAGTNYTAALWAWVLGHGMTENEFIQLVETDDRFIGFFKETTNQQ